MKTVTIIMFILVVVSTYVRVRRNYKVNQFAKKQRKRKEQEAKGE